MSVAPEVTFVVERLRVIRERMTALTLVSNMPRSAWSELCALDSEISVAIDWLADAAKRIPQEQG